jgi:hypothetical protein
VLGGQVECWAGVGWGACSGLGSSILEGCELGFGELIAFTLGVQTLLEAVDSLEQGLEDVRLGPALLGHGIVNTRAVEDLAGLAGWTGAVALDLAGRSVVWWDEVVVVVVCGDGGERERERGRNETRREGGKQQQKKKRSTLRLRQLLQFMASRGSLETRRAGRRSMPIWGLDIVAAVECESEASADTDMGTRSRTRAGGNSGGSGSSVSRSANKA